MYHSDAPCTIRYLPSCEVSFEWSPESGLPDWSESGLPDCSCPLSSGVSSLASVVGISFSGKSLSGGWGVVDCASSKTTQNHNDCYFITTNFILMPFYFKWCFLTLANKLIQNDYLPSRWCPLISNDQMMLRKLITFFEFD